MIKEVEGPAFKLKDYQILFIEICKKISKGQIKIIK